MSQRCYERHQTLHKGSRCSDARCDWWRRQRALICMRLLRHAEPSPLSRLRACTPC